MPDSPIDALPTENAPKRRGRKPGGTNGAPAENTKRQSESIAKIDGMLDIVLSGAGMMAMQYNRADGMIIISGKDRLKASIIELCKQDKRIRDMLLDMATSSAYVGVIIASASIIIPILANHNLIPPIFGMGNVGGANAVQSNGTGAPADFTAVMSN